jgi:hypothetical protein
VRQRLRHAAQTPSLTRAAVEGNRISANPVRLDLAVAWIWIAIALLVNGLIFRWLGGFVGAGQAIERWGNQSARSWARRRGLKGF